MTKYEERRGGDLPLFMAAFDRAEQNKGQRGKRGRVERTQEEARGKKGKRCKAVVEEEKGKRQFKTAGDKKKLVLYLPTLGMEEYFANHAALYAVASTRQVNGKSAGLIPIKFRR
ncbi:unnamed protein product [Fusarium graminearum]|uniref:Chromosome 4, complete genome n=2 Tax=Gibberella zeae (strain ATCC MYA-4620 / CBS 123657 / FGSC 9075 / NRRL 31084 / PH-1) TaxID=229533 RepID=A0A1C3YL42_GIBZE|nr:unnamed protein product [Fusarium graminearum]